MDNTHLFIQYKDSRGERLCSPSDDSCGTMDKTTRLALFVKEYHSPSVTRSTRGATVTECAIVVSFCCKGL